MTKRRFYVILAQSLKIKGVLCVGVVAVYLYMWLFSVQNPHDNLDDKKSDTYLKRFISYKGIK